MAPVVAGTTHMQMEVTMLGGSVMTMLMGVQFKPKRGANRQGSQHQQGHTHQKFRPGRHGFDVGQVFEANGDQGKNHDAGGVTGPPGHGMPKGRQRLVQGEGRHRH